MKVINAELGKHVRYAARGRLCSDWRCRHACFAASALDDVGTRRGDVLELEKNQAAHTVSGAGEPSGMWDRLIRSFLRENNCVDTSK